MVAVTLTAVAVVWIGNEADVVCPAKMMTDIGTGMVVPPVLANVTVTFVAALLVRVTTPLAVTPPLTDVGLMVSLLTELGLTVNVPCTATALYVAVIEQLVLTGTSEVVTVNVVVVAPAARNTDAGTPAATLELVIGTVTPPAGAGPVMVNVAKLLVPA